MDKVGLDVYGIGEHHRGGFRVSAPRLCCVAGAIKTGVGSDQCYQCPIELDPFESTSSMRRLMHCQMAEQEVMAGRGSLSSPFRLAMTFEGLRRALIKAGPVLCQSDADY